MELQEHHLNQVAQTLIATIETGTPFVIAIEKLISQAKISNIDLTENNFLIIMALVAARAKLDNNYA